MTSNLSIREKMKIICKHNKSSNLPSGTPSNFNYGLELEKEYLVMGMVLAENQLWYLVDEHGKPDFYPYQLFQVTEASLGHNWHFKLYSDDDGVFPFNKQSIWGYSELCFDKKHYEGLVDREPGALQLYFMRKAESTF
ncbi:MAG: hypothetical protein H3C47_15890 [Candidatus Cloacimonetes bacterium]|nr:hypothetical protein [Candidatus Cloacimonadota bacterium]